MELTSTKNYQIEMRNAELKDIHRYAHFLTYCGVPRLSIFVGGNGDVEYKRRGNWLTIAFSAQGVNYFRIHRPAGFQDPVTRKGRVIVSMVFIRCITITNRLRR